MSSEMYVRWNIRNMENIHQRLKEQLEKERQHQIEQIKNATDQIFSINRMVENAKSEAKKSDNMRLLKTEKGGTSYDCDTEETFSSGYNSDIENISVVSNSTKKESAVLDWSESLEEFEEKTSDSIKKVAYSKNVIAQINRGALFTKEDIELYDDLIQYLDNLLADSSLDFDYFKDLVDGKLSSLKRLMTASSQNNDELYTYYAICQLLGIAPSANATTDLAKENKRLYSALIDKKKELYVYENLLEVFEELNLEISGDMELDGLLGKQVTDKTIDDCQIFMSIDGDGIVLETFTEVSQNETLSSNQKAHIEESANTICKKHLMVIEKMRERGIDFSIDCDVKPNAESMRKTTSSVLRRKKKQNTEKKLFEV